MCRSPLLQNSATGGQQTHQTQGGQALSPLLQNSATGGQQTQQTQGGHAVPAASELSHWGAADTADTGRSGTVPAAAELSHWGAADTSDTRRLRPLQQTDNAVGSRLPARFFLALRRYFVQKNQGEGKLHYHHNAGCMQLNQEIFFSNRLSPSLCLKVNVHLILRFLSKVDCTNCGGQPDSVNALHPALTQPVFIYRLSVCLSHEQPGCPMMD